MEAILEMISSRIQEDFKAQQNAKLNSEEGGTLYQKRKIDVESVFGQVKQNLNFRRLHLRGNDKVKIELGLVALAHNMRKRVAADRHSQENEKMHNKNHGDQCNQVCVIFSLSGLLGLPPFLMKRTILKTVEIQYCLITGAITIIGTMVTTWTLIYCGSFISTIHHRL